MTSGLPAGGVAAKGEGLVAASPYEARSAHGEYLLGVSRLDPNETGISASVRAVLRRCHSSLRSVEVVLTDGRVILHGWVPSFYLKQVAQEAARRFLTRYGFENRLVVDATRTRRPTGEGGVA